MIAVSGGSIVIVPAAAFGEQVLIEECIYRALGKEIGTSENLALAAHVFKRIGKRIPVKVFAYQIIGIIPAE